MVTSRWKRCLRACRVAAPCKPAVNPERVWLLTLARREEPLNSRVPTREPFALSYPGDRAKRHSLGAPRRCGRRLLRVADPWMTDPGRELPAVAGPGFQGMTWKCLFELCCPGLLLLDDRSQIEPVDGLLLLDDLYFGFQVKGPELGQPALH